MCVSIRTLLEAGHEHPPLPDNHTCGALAEVLNERVDANMRRRGLLHHPHAECDHNHSGHRMRHRTSGAIMMNVTVCLHGLSDAPLFPGLGNRTIAEFHEILVRPRVCV